MEININVTLSPSTEGAILALCESLIGKESAKGLEKEVSIEEVRIKLSEVAKQGRQKEVLELLRKFGGNKLTEIHPKNFQSLMMEAVKLNG